MPTSKKHVPAVLLTTSSNNIKMLLHVLLWLGSCYGLVAAKSSDDNEVAAMLIWFTMVHLLVALLTETSITSDELVVLVGWLGLMHFILFKAWVALDDGVSCEVRVEPDVRRYPVD